jgi:hypothetical protein
MQTIQFTKIGGLQLNLNPVLQNNGQMIRSVNLEEYPFGAVRKRSGYGSYLNNPDSLPVTDLFDWHRNDGTTFWNYRISGSVMYYSIQGTGNWTPAIGGTFASSVIGHTVGYDQATRSDIMVVGDGVGTSVYSTDGTTFQVGTAGIPVASYFENYQGRVWAGGTASTLFYSTTFGPIDWTTDSDNISLTGGGKINGMFKTQDRLNTTKNDGNIFRFDGVNMIDLATKLGPSTIKSLAKVEDIGLFLNRNGFFSHSGDRPIITSNPVERQIYNASGSAIAGTNFDSAPGVTHLYDYFCAVGTVTEDFTRETVPNLVMKHNLQKDSWTNYSFNNNPTAWLSFVNNIRSSQLIFGDSAGQCYTMNGATTDVGVAIASVGEIMIHGNSLLEKEWRRLAVAFNPGCQAVVQVATSNTFDKESKNWLDLGDVSTGKVEFTFPPEARGVFLFLRFIESSKNSAFAFYGGEVDFNILQRY